MQSLRVRGLAKLKSAQSFCLAKLHGSNVDPDPMARGAVVSISHGGGELFITKTYSRVSTTVV